MVPRTSWWVASLAVGVSVGLSAVVVAACSHAPDTNYGNPAGLRRDNIPGEGGLETLQCTGTGTGTDGGTGREAGACAVSWATDIFPKMKADGPWKCADAKCHGGLQAPVITATTPAAAYDSLKDWTIAGSPNPYIAPDAGGDPSKSMMECNLRSQCGQGMPQSPGTAPTHDEICIIDAWLRCGAPNN